MEKQMYAYPVGDFLSGFSKDEQNPCDYELECQRMVIRGVQYLDENQDIFLLIQNDKIDISDERLKPMIDFMCSNEENEKESFGQTGAMVNHTVLHAYHAKRLGWDKYISDLTENTDDDAKA
jgi:hypothetical protein